jgi:hypothetical protein
VELSLWSTKEERPVEEWLPSKLVELITEGPLRGTPMGEVVV